ncbi:uncharacterized protein BBA_06621 [Beauveria bassiana ARSEF 2860]|uniref:Uncharacterized protein n=1 Tax=Beauveria bassiana (strain ARSEF 2860) TaxID=655819 RepID=J4UKD1_BEAB2|nr:uncharacterized protein BBA_06621 [Beauveria bassiana ARSEF 2860]EJP64627.1 hypothetical protein BBA_06621 [Beauveria bassiana ARSEF 2860]
MHFSTLAMMVMFSCRATSLIVEKASLYSKEACKGRAYTVEPDDKCKLLPSQWQKSITGAHIPEGVVCDFYNDERCEAPLWIGMEDPGTCDFSELEIEKQAVAKCSLSRIRPCRDSAHRSPIIFQQL